MELALFEWQPQEVFLVGCLRVLNRCPKHLERYSGARMSFRVAAIDHRPP